MKNSDQRQNSSVLCFVLSLIPTCMGVGYARAASPVSISLEKTSITIGEPIPLIVQVKNTSSDVLELDLGLDGEDNILISMIDPRGQRSEKPSPAPMQQMRFFGGVRLEAGEEYSKTLFLNKWFSFKDVGRYHLQAQLKQPATDNNGNWPVSFSLTLDVAPYNPEVLVGVCRDLASRISKRDSTDGGDYGVAARALGYVRDPVAVPYWDQVLEDSPMMAVSSLYQIGNSAAVQVLARALHVKRDKEARRQARVALKALARDSSDPLLRVQADDALRKP